MGCLADNTSDGKKLGALSKVIKASFRVKMFH
jgi:hypothetical protein